MKSGQLKISILMILVIGGAAALGWKIYDQIQHQGREAKSGKGLRPVPVEVALIEQGPIALRQTFNGELEALAEFVVAPKIGGRVDRMLVDIADAVERGQVVVELDEDEYVHAVAQAQADLVVAGAKLSEAESALEVAEREYQRTESLLKRGIASDSDFDAARQDSLVKKAQLKVAAAQVKKAESSLETAKTRLGYTKVTAGWSGGDDHRIVAERYVDEGQTLAANTPMLSIVEIDPIVGVIFVTEQDYPHLKPGQIVKLSTDAYPLETFSGRIERIAPVFLKSTRQARIEITIDNPQHRLKPGMFITTDVVLVRVPEATVVPEQALTKRNDRSGVFILSGDGKSVVWREVDVGIREGDKVQVTGEGLLGKVVTLGQQLVDNGSPIIIPAEQNQKDAGLQRAEDQ